MTNHLQIVPHTQPGNEHFLPQHPLVATAIQASHTTVSIGSRGNAPVQEKM
jgi:hypothetical protein